MHLDSESLVTRPWNIRRPPCLASDCCPDPWIRVDFEKRIPTPDHGRKDWSDYFQIAREIRDRST